MFGQFCSDLTDDPWTTIIWEDISSHSKYADPITKKYAEDEEFANEQLINTLICNAPVPYMINKTSLGNLAYMAQVHGENSQWMQLYKKMVSALRGYTENPQKLESPTSNTRYARVNLNLRSAQRQRCAARHNYYLRDRKNRKSVSATQDIRAPVTLQPIVDALFEQKWQSFINVGIESAIPLLESIYTTPQQVERIYTAARELETLQHKLSGQKDIRTLDDLRLCGERPREENVTLLEILDTIPQKIQQVLNAVRELETRQHKLIEHLTSQGLKIAALKLPGFNDWADRIQNLLLNNEDIVNGPGHEGVGNSHNFCK